jgi:hypothetical protein
MPGSHKHLKVRALVSLLLLASLLLPASHNNTAASAVATNSAVGDVVAAVGVPWVPAVVQ